LPNRRVLILGAGGMLGHKVFQAAVRRRLAVTGTLRSRLRDHPVAALTEFSHGRVIEDCDAMDIRDVTELLVREQPQVVVNCVGLIKQRAESSDPAKAITLNALLPHKIVEALSRWSGRLIHISTDCVFDGERGLYTEADTPNAPDLYGKTKALGEVFAANALTLRTSIIGRELEYHKSLLDWFLSQNHSRVKGFDNVWWSGVTTNHLAEVILDLMESHPDLCGLYHLSSGRISKYELLRIIGEAYDLRIDLEIDSSYVLDRSLDGRRFVAATGYQFPGWTALMSQLLSDPTPYKLDGEHQK